MTRRNLLNRLVLAILTTAICQIFLGIFSFCRWGKHNDHGRCQLGFLQDEQQDIPIAAYADTVTECNHLKVYNSSKTELCAKQFQKAGFTVWRRALASPRPVAPLDADLSQNGLERPQTFPTTRKTQRIF